MLLEVPMMLRNDKLVCSALHVVMSGTQRAQRCRHHENVITSLCTAIASLADYRPNCVGLAYFKPLWHFF